VPLTRVVSIWQSGAVRLPNRIPAVWLVISGIVSVQVGAAIAKNLFDLVPPTAMVWLRLITSAVILLLVARPRLAGHSGRDWLIVLGFGVSLMTMNWAIYQSFARIPLGIAVTIEFLGPLTVAVIGSRRFADLIWVVLAGIGVALLGVSRASLTLAGVGFALLAALGWAFYILLSAQTGRRWPGISGLAIASMVGAIALAPPAIVEAGNQMLNSTVLMLGLAIELGHSVQLRADRFTSYSAPSLQHLDEPRACGGGARRDDLAWGVSELGAVARHGLCGNRQYRRNSYVNDFGSAGAGLSRQMPVAKR
jgi:inner membrane transporter RhtA